MRKYLYIGLGGALGSLIRYLMSNFIASRARVNLPLNTFIINITGCLLLGFIMTLALEFVKMNTDLRLAVTTGFIGSYTTFSTFTNEMNAMLMNNKTVVFALYLLLSLGAGIVSIWLGTITARKYFSRKPELASEGRDTQ